MTKQLDTTPKNDGFRMPGEFEPHSGCWMIWPERTDNWRLGAKPAQEVFAQVAEAISRFEPVTMCTNFWEYANARSRLPENIRVLEISNNDAWIRDCGATFVINGSEVRGVDWCFNAWGGLVDGLYFPWDKDDAVAGKMCDIEKLNSYHTEGFVLEGGSIHTDGEGTLFTTEECLLSEGRNPHMTKQEIEEKLKEYLSVEKIIWLPKGIYNDETNGHVDNIMHCVAPGKVLLAWTDDTSDPQHEICQQAMQVLSNETDAKGRKLEVTKLMLPKNILITEEESKGVDAISGTLPRLPGDRLAASYANFYIANGGVVVPIFNDPADQAALDTIKSAMPGREVVGIFAREILLGGGNIHCITQQQPKA